MANEIIHRRKNFGGLETTQQVYAEMAWGGMKCDACGGPPALRVQVFLLLSDMTADTRAAIELQIALGKISPIRGPKGTAVRWCSKVACARCAPALERAAAKGVPSYCCVEIDRGPGPDSPIVAVPS